MGDRWGGGGGGEVGRSQAVVLPFTFFLGKKGLLPNFMSRGRLALPDFCGQKLWQAKAHSTKERVSVLGTGHVQANVVRVPEKAMVNTIR